MMCPSSEQCTQNLKIDLFKFGTSKTPDALKSVKLIEINFLEFNFNFKRYWNYFLKKLKLISKKLKLISKK